MTKQSFTPGPWNYQQPAHDSETGDFWVVSGNSIIADVAATVGVTHPVSGEGNARLIAQSPKMFAACVALLTWYSKSSGGEEALFEAIKNAQEAVCEVTRIP